MTICGLGSYSTIVSRPKGRSWQLLCLILGAVNLAAWIWALAEFGNQPALLGTALLAYVFGLRHAVDADHIAAIDNVVRKLMQEEKRPLTAGFFFSLGHSSVVVIATIAVAVTAVALERQFGAFKSVGGIIGTFAVRDLPPGHWLHQPDDSHTRVAHLPESPSRTGNSKPSTWTLCLRGEDFSRGCFGVRSP